LEEEKVYQPLPQDYSNGLLHLKDEGKMRPLVIHCGSERVDPPFFFLLLMGSRINCKKIPFVDP